MPVTQSQNLHGLEITVSPADEPSPVLWTDTEPTLEVLFKNTSDITWLDETEVHVRIEIDDNVVWSEEVKMDRDLSPGESTKVSVKSTPLTYEGHAVVGFSISGVENATNDDHPSSLNSGNNTYKLHPTSAFSVWDESHYISTVRRPKQFQKGIILTSVVLILFAAVQLWLAYTPA